MSDLTARLRALANAEHDDLSVAGEAADRIEELESRLAEHANKSHEDFRAGMKAAAQRCIQIAEEFSYAGAIPQTIAKEFGLEE